MNEKLFNDFISLIVANIAGPTVKDIVFNERIESRINYTYVASKEAINVICCEASSEDTEFSYFKYELPVDLIKELGDITLAKDLASLSHRDYKSKNERISYNIEFNMLGENKGLIWTTFEDGKRVRDEFLSIETFNRLYKIVTM